MDRIYDLSDDQIDTHGEEIWCNIVINFFNSEFELVWETVGSKTNAKNSKMQHLDYIIKRALNNHLWRWPKHGRGRWHNLQSPFIGFEEGQQILCTTSVATSTTTVGWTNEDILDFVNVIILASRLPLVMSETSDAGQVWLPIRQTCK